MWRVGLFRRRRLCPGNRGVYNAANREAAQLTISDILAMAALMTLLAASPAHAQSDPQKAAAAPALATMAAGTLTPVVGRFVHDSEGAEVGRVWDVLVDSQGVPRAAVIDYGGVLGIGRRKVAVAWPALRFGMSDAVDDVTVALTKEQLGAIPEYHYATGDATIGDKR